MAQKKGQTGNPNGRPKGTPNRVTTDLRQWVNTLIESNREQLEADLAKLEPKERWQLIEKLIQYVIPKKRDEEENDNNNQRSEILKRLFGEKD
ncbi:MAG: DUF5681 domain-containing protein [Prevotellaceae bacterium]|jgi:cell division protein FtsN|nr:DUF5681 domain-containing protein [Prevotellaceae bacterium]